MKPSDLAQILQDETPFPPPPPSPLQNDGIYLVLFAT